MQGNFKAWIHWNHSLKFCFLVRTKTGNVIISIDALNNLKLTCVITMNKMYT